MSARNRLSGTKWTLRLGFAITGTLAIQLQGCTSAPYGSHGFARMPLSVEGDEFAEGADRPPTAKTLYALARLMDAQGKRAECEVVLGRTIQRFPEFSPAYLDWASLKIKEGRPDDAIAIIQQGLDFSEDDPVLWNDLGMCRMIKCDYAHALEAFERAAAIEPAGRRYTCNAALALGMLGRYDDCLTAYEQVIGLARAHYNLAVICEARNDIERAGEEYAAARQLNGFIRRKDLKRGGVDDGG